MQKKNLDELFRDKLSDFKQTPDNKVWRAIDASLNKKKKRRVIPIWWQLSGIAAALALGLILFNSLSSDQQANQILVDTDNPIEEAIEKQSNSTKEILADPIDIDNNELVEQSSIEKGNHNNLESSIHTGQNESTSVDDIANKNNINHKPKSQPSVVFSESDSKSNSNTSHALVAENSTIKEVNKNNIDSSDNNHFKNIDIAKNDEKSRNSIDFKNIEAENTIAENSETKEVVKKPKTDKKSIFEEIENQEELKKEKVASNRWSAGPNVAPVYFSALGEGSPVNSIFTPNSKSGNVNMSYGVSVAYAVTKKLTIRSGINKVDYGYDTEDVAFSSSSSFASSNGQLATIDYAETSNTLTISSKIVTSDKYSTTNSALDVTAKSPTRDGYMSQQFGYLELPVELNYALIDKKFGVNIIGGVSSLLLINNSVSLTAGELTTEIGEANNINDVNFSANMGLGLNYNFSQKIRFNVEPIFKYQLNTFSEINGTFRPYSVGVYSGLTFKF
ncbi:hypothetical protein LCGC14_0079150 [marine sediment metagenome]|uniref:Outer membrane protein beta-barrel domain-containing protein n=1 Tax=marine sediment metagenome TaxID=412755 RepID=A0A0F9VLZ9_9ZZZZ|nr:outer membrane beta-barrel protein [Maribacter sp.]HDZ04509.1 PorT family protein [Maribacter sp.]HEA80863.1 PorT family protein [Maribacter sp.]